MCVCVCSPCKSSDIRDVLYGSNISDYPESADENDVEGLLPLKKAV